VVYNACYVVWLLMCALSILTQGGVLCNPWNWCDCEAHKHVIGNTFYSFITCKKNLLILGCGYLQYQNLLIAMYFQDACLQICSSA